MTANHRIGIQYYAALIAATLAVYWFFLLELKSQSLQSYISEQFAFDHSPLRLFGFVVLQLCTTYGVGSSVGRKRVQV